MANAGVRGCDTLVCMTAPDTGTSEAPVRIDGPWTHRDVAANGARFHIAELGDGPLVLLLHGFPQFWWTWRHQLTALAEAGFRAVAMDLRGVGGSDRTPRGYDPANLALDVTGVDPLARRAGRGAGRARPGRLSGVDGRGDAAEAGPAARGVLDAAPAPLALGDALRRRAERGRARTSGASSGRGCRSVSSSRTTRRLVGRLIRDWSGPRPPERRDAVDVYRRAMCIPSTAHCSIEPYRWMVRSMARPDGIQFNRRMKRPVRVPTLHLHGSLDPVMRTRSAAGSGEYVEAPYRWRLFDGLGHFPHEEDPVAFSTELINWLKDPEPDR